MRCVLSQNTPSVPELIFRSKFGIWGLSVTLWSVTLVDSCRPSTCHLPLLDSKYISRCRHAPQICEICKEKSTWNHQRSLTALESWHNMEVLAAVEACIEGVGWRGGGSVRIWPTTWDKASSPGYESHHVLNLRQNSLNLLWFHIVPYQVGAISGTWFHGPCLKGRVRNTHVAASWSSHTLWLHVPWWWDACCIIILPLLIIDCLQPKICTAVRGPSVCLSLFKAFCVTLCLGLHNATTFYYSFQLF